MKKALLTLVALSVSVSLFAQGTVTFSNIGSGKPAQFDENGDGVGDRALAAADGVQLSLWFAPAGTTDLNAPTWQMVGVPISPLSGGLFTAARTVPGAVQNDLYSFQVRAWETAVYGSTSDGWAAASAAPVAKITVKTPLVEAGTGGWGSPPSTAVNLAPLFGAAGQPNITVATVPEPSVLALGVLGVGALLMLRRRK